MGRRSDTARNVAGSLLAPALILAAWPCPAVAGDLSFNRDIRPILSENCLFCHGQDGNKRKADLRLDDRESAIEAGAIVPGKPEESLLVERIFSADPDEVMPPIGSHRQLSDAQRQTVRRWVEEGAPYEPHWAFNAPVRPGPPEVRGKDWVRNPIDSFVLAELEGRAISPSPEADRFTLVRRLYIDLLGLPPKPEEVDAFVKDGAPDAYENLVDRLLASPHYGERMVLPWLDAARYADSNGFQQDGDTYQWVWRDWCVEAINEDMPFDQFSTEQLAGDLMPDPTRQQLYATAFNRNHLLNGEGGAIAEEQRNVIVFDRVDTTATTWLGLTMACAQCHDHKYDPITMRDYYGFFAYFNNVPESGTPPGGGQYRIADPSIPGGSEDDVRKLAELEGEKDALSKAEVEMVASEETGAAFQAWLGQIEGSGETVWKPVVPAKVEASEGVALEVEDGAVFVREPKADKAVYKLTLPATAEAVTGFRIDTIPDGRLPFGGAGWGDSGNAVLTKWRVRSGGREIPLTAAEADYSQQGFPPGAAIDDKEDTGWAFFPDVSKPHHLMVQSATPVEPDPAAPLVLELEFLSAHVLHMLGHFRLSVTASPQPLGRGPLPDEVKGVLAGPAEGRSKEGVEVLRKHFLGVSPPPGLQDLRARRTAAENAWKSHRDGMPRVMVMSDARPRVTRILDRGEYLNPTEEVTAATPAFLPGLADAPANRLGLARWLFSPENPLTARVQVNRMWQLFFGKGLVVTSEDLGVQSEVPLHEGLLDWLAVEFRDGGWSRKRMHRLIVTSATYRQSSKISPQQLASDPENLLYGRGARFRAPSLILRDIALAASGLLDTRVGGKPVYPYQPDGIWETLAITKERDFSYPASQGKDLYRRSLYTFWRRTVAPANMFDGASRQTCSVRPSITSTPLHALTTLNDPTWVEAARVLAGDILKREAGADARLVEIFHRILARDPQPVEMDLLRRSLDTQRAIYAGGPESARQLLAVGSTPRDETLDPVEHAALTAVCLAVFNLDEALTKE